MVKHDGHDVVDVATSWGGYRRCVTCDVIVSADSADPDTGELTTLDYIPDFLLRRQP